MELKYPHILQEFQLTVDLSDSDRISFLGKPRWIEYPQASNLLSLLRDLMNAHEKPRMLNLLVVGESNNGKTTIIHQFYETYGTPYEDENENPVRPIIMVNAPPGADEKSLYFSILEKFWTPYKANDSKSKLMYQVINQMRRLKVELLVIDEIHSLLTGTPSKQREVMEVIKLLCNELRIPIVGVGTKDAIKVLHTDPQHASRFDVAPLPTWSEDENFQKLLASFEQILPLKKPSTLSDPELASLLHSISGGNFGNLHRLLIECATEAIKSGKEKIDKEIIRSKSWVRPTSGGIRELKL